MFLDLFLSLEPILKTNGRERGRKREREGRVERRKGGRGGRKKITMYLNSGNTVKF